jgi:hypothetical protein
LPVAGTFRLVRRVLACAVVVGSLGTAFADGPDPGVLSIHFERGDARHIVAGTTFGLLLSDDAGASWQWMCESSLGYQWPFNPDYVYTASGSLFATSFNGLRVLRPQDRCGFGDTPAGGTFVARVAGGADGAVYYAASDAADVAIYKSTDDGATFVLASSPGVAGDWWSSLQVARSNAQRIYLTGYRFTGTVKTHFAFTSSDGGAAFAPISTADFTPISDNSAIEIVGIDPQDDRIVYAKIDRETGTLGDSVYRSTNAGQSWTKILTRQSQYGLAFLVRADGSCVAGTRELGVWRSPDCATAASPTWTALPGAPHTSCLAEDPSGVVWACTQNFAFMPPPTINVPPIPSDGFGIMTSADLTTWTGVLQFRDIAGPVACGPGTAVQDQCVQPWMGQRSTWCCLVNQLGITSQPVACTGALSCSGAGLVDGTPDGGVTDAPPPPPPPCCGAGNGPSSAVLTGIVALLAARPRKRWGRRAAGRAPR